MLLKFSSPKIYVCRIKTLLKLHTGSSIYIRAGIRLKLSKDTLIKVLDYGIRINKKFIRKKSDFHACDFLGLEALQLTGLRTRAWPC